VSYGGASLEGTFIFAVFKRSSVCQSLWHTCRKAFLALFLKPCGKEILFTKDMVVVWRPPLGTTALRWDDRLENHTER
jgi:hypothetical protein